MTSPDEGTPTRGRLARTARLAALPAAYVGRTAVGLGKRIGGRPAEMVAAQVQQRTAEQLFATLGQLKGGAMKVGQAMSAMESALPEQLAGPYREALARLQEAAPPMPMRAVHEQLDRLVRRGLAHELFRDFDDRPARPRQHRAGAPRHLARRHGRWRSRCSTRAPPRRSSPTSACCRALAR